MFEVFKKLTRVAEEVGTVNSAMMYESGFITVDGKTKDGKKFSLTLSIKEEEKNGN